MDIQKLRSRRWQRATSLVVVLITAVGLLGVGMIFSSSFSASQVAGQARSLHWTNAALGTAGIARASIAQAVFFSFDIGGADSNPDVSQVAIDEAQANLRALELMLSTSELRTGSLQESIRIFLDQGDHVIALVAVGDAREAELERVSKLEPSFETLKEQLTNEQTELADKIAEFEASARRVSNLTQLALALVLPAMMIVLWFALRRRIRKNESAMRADLESQGQMNAAKDDFIAGLSHELRTPLTVIHGFSEVLLDDNGLDANSSELIGLINAASTELSRMVDDLLVAARLDADALTARAQPVDLAEQAQMVAAPYLRTGEKLEVKVPSIQVYADPLHVRQVIHNLVSNAQRHGGDTIVISAHEKNGKAHLIVADDGEGVSRDAEKRLFQRFSNRGHEALVVGSVGLGLAVSQELAMRMGGFIRYTRVDGWTVFTVRLPVIPTMAARDNDILAEAISAMS